MDICLFKQIHGNFYKGAKKTQPMPRSTKKKIGGINGALLPWEN